VSEREALLALIDHLADRGFDHCERTGTYGSKGGIIRATALHWVDAKYPHPPATEPGCALTNGPCQYRTEPVGPSRGEPKVIECGKCNGTGRWLDNYNKTCSGCEGAGRWTKDGPITPNPHPLACVACSCPSCGAVRDFVVAMAKLHDYPFDLGPVVVAARKVK